VQEGGSQGHKGSSGDFQKRRRNGGYFRKEEKKGPAVSHVRTEGTGMVTILCSTLRGGDFEGS